MILIKSKRLTLEKSQAIEELLKMVLRKKFQSYNPEGSVMPFHARLLGKDRLALYSFIQSLNTSFGVSIFEQVAQSVAEINFQRVELGVVSGVKISSDAQLAIQRIIDNLRTASIEPDKEREIEIIRQVCQTGEMRTIKPTKIDLFLERDNGEIFCVDIKSAKPNKGEFIGFKRTLLEWVAVILAQNPDVQINTLVAIPYNPYMPQPYDRWTMRGMLDLQYELKVAEEFWDFLAGHGSYEEILECFERVGIAMRDEIDEYFSRFRRM